MESLAVAWHVRLEVPFSQLPVRLLLPFSSKGVQSLACFQALVTWPAWSRLFFFLHPRTRGTSDNLPRQPAEAPRGDINLSPKTTPPSYLIRHLNQHRLVLRRRHRPAFATAMCLVTVQDGS